MNNVKVTGFSAAPPFARGLVRDLRVRWALEEAGQPYETVLVDPEERDAGDNRARHPFGMVPAFESDGGGLFESGAILYRIARRSETLMPADEQGREQTLVWMFAALNTVEPAVNPVFDIDNVHVGEAWAEQRRPAAVALATKRIEALARWLEGRDYVTGRFTVADILMATVLRFVRGTELIAQFPAVAAYLARCEARPAFARALQRQVSEYPPLDAVAA